MNFCRNAAVAALGLGLSVGGGFDVGLAPAPAAAKEEYQLPPEVTPAIRAACETDVRRLCIGQEPNVEKVKSCVMQKFFKLNKQCQVRLISAGFSP